ncbi:TetR/AcrR family transcriptional regulator [Streptomyces sp. HNM0574]|uniref:TetR family transcriptional regulator C-terminal domain-containing protein n=1 Tax=Streptomyces sp. HNM0574 TaxID=2714954 RepID=UPI00146EBF3C|nr:TetR/AcrR family transcriptional regulator [Streptomyces sp. HNM0574]
MPKRVDHAERRAHIIDALVRVAAREGPHAVTMRSVAAEADVSLRVVQYYFDSKAELTRAALQRLEEQSHQRWAERLEGLPQPVTAPAFVEAFTAEALPSDEPSRTFHQVWTSYATLARTDPELADQPLVEGPARLEGQLRDILQQAQDDGTLAPKVDAEAEAARLLAVSHGLGTGVLVGLHSPETARTVLRYHLADLFDDAGHPGGPHLDVRVENAERDSEPESEPVPEQAVEPRRES